MPLIASMTVRDRRSNAEAHVYSFVRNDGGTIHGAAVVAGDGVEWHRLFTNQAIRDEAVARAFRKRRRIDWFA